MTIEKDNYYSAGKQIVETSNLHEEQKAWACLLMDAIWQIAHPSDADEQKDQERELRKYFGVWKDNKEIFLTLWQKAGGNMALLNKVIESQDSK